MLTGNQTNPLPNIMLFQIISVNLQLHLCVKICEFPGFGAIMASRHHFIKENLRDGVQMLDGKECEGFGWCITSCPSLDLPWTPLECRKLSNQIFIFHDFRWTSKTSYRLLTREDIVTTELGESMSGKSVIIWHPKAIQIVSWCIQLLVMQLANVEIILPFFINLVTSNRLKKRWRDNFQYPRI